LDAPPPIPRRARARGALARGAARKARPAGAHARIPPPSPARALSRALRSAARDRRLPRRGPRRGRASRLFVRRAQDRRARRRAPDRRAARAGRVRMAPSARKAARARPRAPPAPRADGAARAAPAVSHRRGRRRLLGAAMIETRFTKLVGATAPIQVASMPGISTAELVAAAADAGAVGMI